MARELTRWIRPLPLVLCSVACSGGRGGGEGADAQPPPPAPAPMPVPVPPADAGPPGTAHSPIDFAQYVDPFIGTDGSGETTPSATVPFGMVQFGPETSNHTYKRTSFDVRGFSLTHFSGAGCPNGGDFPIMPTNRAVTSDDIKNAFQLHYDGVPPSYLVPTDEASPGFYRAYALRAPTDTGTASYEVQLTATTRSGFGKFIFPSAGPGNALAFNVGRGGGAVTDAQVTVDAAHQHVSGWVASGDFCDPDPNRYKAYFSARFDQPIASFGTWDSADGGSSYTVSQGNASVTSKYGGAFVGFSAGTVHVKVGFSYVSTANADLNVSNEAPNGGDWGADFASIKQQARQAWSDSLWAVNVNGKAAGASAVNLKKFYTALYHTMLYPNVFSDVNGQYIGDELGGGIVHTDTARVHYANYSGWDIYRGEIQLVALLSPRGSDILQSMVDFAKQGSALPHWGYANDEADIMNGDSAGPIIANGYAFGAHDFDTQAAKTFMRKAADDPNDYDRQGRPVRDKLAQYLTGYVQGVGDSWAWSGNCQPNAAGTDCDDQAGNPPGSGFAPGAGRGYSGSETLEYALDDYALAMFMKATGEPQAQYQPYLDRSGNWRNILDSQGFPHPRNADKTWVAECARPATQLGCFDPKRGNGFDESTPTEYRWLVPQDLPGLVAALGGPAAAKTMLDAMLSVMEKGMPMDDHFPVGNEPVIHAPWVYNAMGYSSATQYNVRKMIGLVGWDGNPAGRPWTENADGIPGNDDLGEMSSVFAWANLGFYPVTPGTGELSINGPLFGEVTLTLANGVKVHITASGAADDAPYIQSLTFDGHPVHSSTLAVADLLAPPPKGQTQHELAYVMASTPPMATWP